ACAFFRSGFVEADAQDATTPLEKSLDDPVRTAPRLPFLSRIHADAGGRILRRVQTLAQRCERELQPSSFEEDFLVLSEELLLLYAEVQAQMERLPGVKRSTREEVFRRLQRG